MKGLIADRAQLEQCLWLLIGSQVMRLLTQSSAPEAAARAWITARLSEIRDVFQEELFRDPFDPDAPDTENLCAHLSAMLFDGQTKEGIREILRSTDEWDQKHNGSPVPPPDTPAPAPESMWLHIDGRSFRQTGGAPWVLRGITGFRIVDLIAKGEPAAADAYLRYAASEGFNTVRTLTTALNGFIDLLPEDGQRALPVALRMARSHGLYLACIGLSDTFTRPIDWRQHARQVARICHEHDNAIFELINEPWNHPHLDIFDDMPFVDDLARQVTEGLPRLMWTAGAARTDEDSIPTGRFAWRHLDRGRDPLNQVRRIAELVKVRNTLTMPLCNGEPIGADELHGDESDPPRQRFNMPWFFYAMGALQSLWGLSGVFHLQDGLETVLPRPVQRACARAYMAGTHLVRDDEQVPPRAYQNAGHDGSPVKAGWFQEPGDASTRPDSGPIIRAYAGVLEDRVADLVILHDLDDSTPTIRYDAHAHVQLNGWWTIQSVDHPYPFVTTAKVVRQ